MSRTTKPLQKSRSVSEERKLHELIVGSSVTLVHVITEELMYGKVVGYPDEPDGCTVRRTDQWGNVLLLMAIELADDDYQIKEIDGHAM